MRGVSVLFTAFLLLLLFYRFGESDRVTSIDVHRTKVLLERQEIPHHYLDVRTEKEFNEGHLKNAVNIPYMVDTPQGREKNPKFVAQVSAVYGKEDHLVVGCRSGVRSLYATADLLEADFKNVANMEGGFLEWINKGFPVVEEAADSEL